MAAYGLPLETTESALPTAAYFGGPARDFGYVAHAEGVPVSTATVMALEEWLCDALVATGRMGLVKYVALLKGRAEFNQAASTPSKERMESMREPE